MTDDVPDGSKQNWAGRNMRAIPVFGPVRNVALGHGKADHVTQIEVRSDGESLSVQSFPPGRIIVGRSPDNEIYIKSKFVSRHHAQLVSDDEGCVLEDLNSTNGVFLNDKQIKKYRLRDGDMITLGVHQLVYRDLRAAVDETDEENSGADVDDNDIGEGEASADAM